MTAVTPGGAFQLLKEIDVKPSDLRPIRVTHLAVVRWLEHASVYGDETDKDVLREFGTAVPVPHDEQLPFPRMPSSLYFKLRRDERVYFIVEDMLRRRGYYLLKTIVNPQNWHPSWRDGYVEPDHAAPADEAVIAKMSTEARNAFANDLRKARAIIRAISHLTQEKESRAGDRRAVALIDERIADLRAALNAADKNEVSEFDPDTSLRMTLPVASLSISQCGNYIRYLNRRVDDYAEGDPVRAKIHARIRALAVRYGDVKIGAGAQPVVAS